MILSKQRFDLTFEAIKPHSQQLIHRHTGIFGFGRPLFPKQNSALAVVFFATKTLSSCYNGTLFRIRMFFK